MACLALTDDVEGALTQRKRFSTSALTEASFKSEKKTRENKSLSSSSANASFSPSLPTTTCLFRSCFYFSDIPVLSVAAVFDEHPRVQISALRSISRVCEKPRKAWFDQHQRESTSSQGSATGVRFLFNRLDRFRRVWPVVKMLLEKFESNKISLHLFPDNHTCQGRNKTEIVLSVYFAPSRFLSLASFVILLMMRHPQLSSLHYAGDSVTVLILAWERGKALADSFSHITFSFFTFPTIIFFLSRFALGLSRSRFWHFLLFKQQRTHCCCRRQHSLRSN